MVPAPNLLGFALASALLIAIPGPSVLFVIGRSLALGRRGGLLSVVGNAAGMVPQIVAVALGVGAIVAQSVVVFTIIKFAGAGLPGVPRHPGDPASQPPRDHDRRHDAEIGVAAHRRGLPRRD